MSIVIGDNFNLQGKKPNFARDTFKTLQEMKRYPDTSIDEGHVSVCLETGKRYEWKSTNPVDEITGRWRLTVDTAIDDSSENPVQNKVIAKTLKDYQEDVKESLKESLQEFLERIESNEEVTVKSIENLRESFEIVNRIVAAGLSELERSKLDKDFEINGYKLTEGNLNLTKSDVGLDQVDNTSDEDKPVSRAVDLAKADKYWFRNLNEMTPEEEASLAGLPAEIIKLRELYTKAEIDQKVDGVVKDVSDHANQQGNVHNLTLEDLGLSLYPHGEKDGKLLGPADLPVPDYMKNVVIAGHHIYVFDEADQVWKLVEITLSKSDVGLDQVDNTSDEDKPLSAIARELHTVIKNNTETIDKIVSTALNEIIEALDTNRQTVAASLNDLNLRLQNLEREK